MKAKKFLKTIQAVCTIKNCEIGKCPLAYPHTCSNGKTVSFCMLDISNMADWNIDKICKNIKDFEKKNRKLVSA